MNKKLTETEAWNIQGEGFEAATISWVSHENPYEIGSEAAAAWEQGYSEGISRLATER